MLLFLLCGCTHDEEVKYFDNLFETNYDYAYGLDRLSNPGTSYTVLDVQDVDFSNVYMYSMWNEVKKEFLNSVDRVIYAKYTIEFVQFFYGDKISVIECKSEEAAQKLYKLMDTKEYLIEKNIIYICDYFGIAFVHGLPLSDNKFLYVDEPKILTFVDDVKETDEIVVDDKYKIVSMGAFANEVKKITFKNMEVIGTSACFKNETLESVVLNEGLKYIYQLAFAFSKNLKQINLPSTLEEIGDYAFFECPLSNNIVIPKSVETIGEFAFSSGTVYCEALSIPEGWNENFADINVKVYWGNEWEYNEDGIPTPIK